ncbi:60S ribosomal protein L18 [Trifolium repens]|nr:60S ribosomal protein L18 [Trifolium repens]
MLISNSLRNAVYDSLPSVDVVQLCRFLVWRTDSGFNKVILKCLFMSKVNKPPLTLSRLIRFMKGKEGKIGVVVGPVTYDIRVYEVPAMKDDRLTPQINTSLFSELFPHLHAFRETSQKVTHPKKMHLVGIGSTHQSLKAILQPYSFKPAQPQDLSHFDANSVFS